MPLFYDGCFDDLFDHRPDFFVRKLVCFFNGMAGLSKQFRHAQMQLMFAIVGKCCMVPCSHNPNICILFILCKCRHIASCGKCAFNCTPHHRRYFDQIRFRKFRKQIGWEITCAFFNTLPLCCVTTPPGAKCRWSRTWGKLTNTFS